MLHYYTVEQEGIAGIKGESKPAIEPEEVTWEYVRGNDGGIVHNRDGRLMVNNKGEYASDTGFHLVTITDHEVQQARAKHELREAGFMQLGTTNVVPLL